MKESETFFASAARTATSSVQQRLNSPYGIFVINVTAVTSTPSVVFTISGVDNVSGATWDILISAAITGTGTTVLRIHPSLTAATNTIAKDILPEGVKITATHADTDSITYSVSFIGMGE